MTDERVARRNPHPNLLSKQQAIRMMSPGGQKKERYGIRQPIQTISLFMIKVTILESDMCHEGL